MSIFLTMLLHSYFLNFRCNFLHILLFFTYITVFYIYYYFLHILLFFTYITIFIYITIFYIYYYFLHILLFFTYIILYTILSTFFEEKNNSNIYNSNIMLYLKFQIYKKDCIGDVYKEYVV